jgi:hypothetical protein
MQQQGDDDGGIIRLRKEQEGKSISITDYDDNNDSDIDVYINFNTSKTSFIVVGLLVMTAIAGVKLVTDQWNTTPQTIEPPWVQSGRRRVDSTPRLQLKLSSSTSSISTTICDTTPLASLNCNNDERSLSNSATSHCDIDKEVVNDATPAVVDKGKGDRINKCQRVSFVVIFIIINVVYCSYSIWGYLMPGCNCLVYKPFLCCVAISI